MVYRGLMLDVSAWSERHPGGFGMINGHGGEAIDHLFDMFHAGCPAPLATLFGLQCGIAQEEATPSAREGQERLAQNHLLGPNRLWSLQWRPDCRLKDSVP